MTEKNLDHLAPNSVQIQQNSTGLCICTGKPAANVAAGDYLVMRPSDPSVASQAWVFPANPGTIAWAGNTSLQIGWDEYGKVQLVSAPGGLVFSFDEASGTFTNDDNGTTEYLTWAGVQAYPEHIPLRANPTYITFTADWTLIPRT